MTTWESRRSDPSGLASLSAAQLASIGQLKGTLIPAGASVSVRGAVKTPGLRNVELTAPFFLNGGQATLEQVVDFYSRGGDFPSADVDPNLERAGFSADDKAAVVAFLKSLTDERVRSQSAPFDHPSLIVPNGMIDGGWSFQRADDHDSGHRRHRRRSFAEVLFGAGRRTTLGLQLGRDGTFGWLTGSEGYRDAFGCQTELWD